MSYQGPRETDYQNVEALNAAFLTILGDPRRSQRLLQNIPDGLKKRFSSLSGVQRGHLAKAPFLLFSFREHDSQFWDHLFEAGRNWQLFEPATSADPELSELLHAALGFVWQSVRNNSYSARVVCGASLHWCEQLADKPLLEVVNAASGTDMLRLRLDSDELFWRKLFYSGTAGERVIREAAHLSALHRLLTEGHEELPARQSRAASHLRRPVLQVAEDNER